jgi:hypothetical protein
MIVVIQCAASKQTNAGCFRTDDGRRVLFVAQPDMVPPSGMIHHARPDDLSDAGASWREELMRYNADRQGNPLGLLPAISLYTHPTYARLAKKVDADRLFILSAGWGLLPASFLTPNYDITFSPQAEPYKRRRRTDPYCDFAPLPDDDNTPMVFFGGKDYVPLFAQLTQTHRGPRTVFFNSQQPPAATGCLLERFVTNTRTNWHYECADAWLGQLRPH